MLLSQNEILVGYITMITTGVTKGAGFKILLSSSVIG